MVYIYDGQTKGFKCSLTGSYAAIILNISSDEDFTLTPPPNTHEQWRWIDNKWVADDTAE